MNGFVEIESMIISGLDCTMVVHPLLSSPNNHLRYSAAAWSNARKSQALRSKEKGPTNITQTGKSTMAAASSNVVSFNPGSSLGSRHSTPQIRLHRMYMALTFKFKEDYSSEQDMRREGFFRSLMLFHLQQSGFTNVAEWTVNDAAREQCIFDFIKIYGKKLWPGKTALRSHLAVPHVKAPKATRSFITGFDSHTPKATSFVASSAGSKMGKALNRYVTALLVLGLKADTNDTTSLLEGIVQTNFLAAPSEPEVAVKMEQMEFEMSESGVHG